MLLQRIKINVKKWRQVLENLLPCTTILLSQKSTPITALSLALLVGNRKKIPSLLGQVCREPICYYTYYR